MAFNKVVNVSKVRNYGFHSKDKLFLQNEDLVNRLTGWVKVYKPPKTDLDKELAKLHPIDFKSNLQSEQDEFTKINHIFQHNSQKHILNEIHEILEANFEKAWKDTLPDYDWLGKGGRRDS